MITSAWVALTAFVVMEPVTYLTHRFVMHGLGMRLHRSHHRRWPTRRADDPFFEANDAFPVFFAAITMAIVAVGLNVDRWSVLVPVCVGVTIYGAAYAFVHDGYIHGRIPVPGRNRWLDHLAWAHGVHHRYGGEPYGMLAPVVPRSLRARDAGAGSVDHRNDQRVARAGEQLSRSSERIGPVPGP